MPKSKEFSITEALFIREKEEYSGKEEELGGEEKRKKQKLISWVWGGREMDKKKRIYQLTLFPSPSDRNWPLLTSTAASANLQAYLHPPPPVHTTIALRLPFYTRCEASFPRPSLRHQLDLCSDLAHSPIPCRCSLAEEHKDIAGSGFALLTQVNG